MSRNRARPLAPERAPARPKDSLLDSAGDAFTSIRSSRRTTLSIERFVAA